MYDDYMGVPGFTAPGTTPTYTNTSSVGINNGAYNNYNDDYMGVPGYYPNQNQGSANLTVPVTPPVPPNTAPPSQQVVVKSPVKIATPQYVDFNEAKLNPITTNEILNLYFEEINGHALLLLNNTNFVNTPSINYQPIVNMWEIAKRYDPKKILGLQDTADTYFNNFSIKLENKIPKVPSSESTNGKNVYIATSQDLILTAVVVGYNRSARLVIETVNMEKDERVEIEILSDGTIDTDLIEEYGS